MVAMRPIGALAPAGQRGKGHTRRVIVDAAGFGEHHRRVRQEHRDDDHPIGEGHCRLQNVLWQKTRIVRSVQPGEEIPGEEIEVTPRRQKPATPSMSRSILYGL